MNVPLAVRPYAGQGVAASDAVCLEHPDIEYAHLCRSVVGNLGLRRPAPLVRVDLRIWASGGRPCRRAAELVCDPAQTPHATADQLGGRLGVKKATMANKGRSIRSTLKLSHADGEFMRRDLVDAGPLTWLLEVNGMLVAIRHAPPRLQVMAVELGLIPSLPRAADDPP